MMDSSLGKWMRSPSKLLHQMVPLPSHGRSLCGSCLTAIDGLPVRCHMIPAAEIPAHRSSTSVRVDRSATFSLPAGRWTSCSDSCVEAGSQTAAIPESTRDVGCKRFTLALDPDSGEHAYIATDDVAEDALCPEAIRPPAARVCPVRLCPAYELQWSPWSECSVPCVRDGEVQGWRTRQAYCVEVQSGTVVSEDMCPGAADGDLHEAEMCGDACPTEQPWVQYGAWQECTAVCGGGQATREATCFIADTPQETMGPCEDAGLQITTVTACHTEPCEKWHWEVGVWTPCPGEEQSASDCSDEPQARTRTVRCVQVDGPSPGSVAPAGEESALCSTHKPRTDQPCPRVPCVGSRICAGVDCGDHGTCNERTGGCSCEVGWAGELCHLHPEDDCPSGLLDSAGECCGSGLLSRGGECCASGSKIDSRGDCCASGVLDACGTCDGDAKAQVGGFCCRGGVTQDRRCCDVEFDVCGQCGGHGESCALESSAMGASDVNMSTDIVASRLKTSLAGRLGIAESRMLIEVSSVASRRFLASISSVFIRLLPGIPGVSTGSLTHAIMSASVLTVSPDSPPVTHAVYECGNGICEPGEGLEYVGGSVLEGGCPEDCHQGALPCVVSGDPLSECGGKGWCIDGVCACYVGYTGDACEVCDYGFIRGPTGDCLSYTYSITLARTVVATPAPTTQPPATPLATTTPAPTAESTANPVSTPVATQPTAGVGGGTETSSSTSAPSETPVLTPVDSSASGDGLAGMATPGPTPALTSTPTPRLTSTPTPAPTPTPTSSGTATIAPTETPPGEQTTPAAEAGNADAGTLSPVTTPPISEGEEDVSSSVPGVTGSPAAAQEPVVIRTPITSLAVIGLDGLQTSYPLCSSSVTILLSFSERVSLEPASVSGHISGPWVSHVEAVQRTARAEHAFLATVALTGDGAREIKIAFSPVSGAETVTGMMGASKGVPASAAEVTVRCRDPGVVARDEAVGVAVASASGAVAAGASIAAIASITTGATTGGSAAGSAASAAAGAAAILGMAGTANRTAASRHLAPSEVAPSFTSIAGGLSMVFGLDIPSPIDGFSRRLYAAAADDDEPDATSNSAGDLVVAFAANEPEGDESDTETAPEQPSTPAVAPPSLPGETAFVVGIRKLFWSGVLLSGVLGGHGGVAVVARGLLCSPKRHKGKGAAAVMRGWPKPEMFALLFVVPIVSEACSLVMSSAPPGQVRC